MENSSSALHSCTRKRKTYTQPPLPDRILTRSRTSTFARSNPVSRKSTPLLSGSNCGKVYCVRDLRARRIFTPDVNSILKHGEEAKGLDPSPVLEDVELGMGEVEMSDAVRDVDVKDDSGLDSVEIDRDLNLKEELIQPSSEQPIFRNKMAVNTCKRRKVFASSSHSLKRMLPFLMDIANESGDSKFEIQGVASSYTMLRSDVKSENQVKSTETVADQSISNVADRSIGDGMDLKTDNMKQIDVQTASCGNFVSKPDSSVETECGQLTPPDQSIFSKMDVGNDGQRLKSQVHKDFSLGGEQSNHVSWKEIKGNANVRVLNPCSRPRLFRNPNSVSYRRLLPFLMNMSKEDSCTSTMNQQPSPLLSKRTSDPPLGSSAEQIEHLTEDQEHNDLSSVSPQPESSSPDADCVPILPSLLPSANNTQYSSELKEHNLVLPLVDNALSKACASEEDELAADQQKCFDVHGICNKNGESVEKICFNQTFMKVVVSDTMVSPSGEVLKSILKRNPERGERNCNLPTLLKQGSDESASDSAESPSNDIKSSGLKDHNLVLPLSPVDDGLSKQFTSEEHELAANQMECFNVVGVCNKHGESVEKLGSNESSSKVVVSDMMVSPSSIGVSKGILKRNPRGCRGPCNCLNCASFRLHAERAFEFSRNQMHGSEEVASDLINELTSLRLMLEKSAVQADDLATIQLSLVREACKKALEAEKLAKERLNQMNYDLNVHCRIPALLQPQVTFSCSVKERDISFKTQI